MRTGFLLLPLLLLGCASTTTVTTQYYSEGGQPANTLLLVADSPEAALRRDWELSCQNEIGSDQLTVLLSHQQKPQWYQGGQASILGWAEANAIPRVLIVDLTLLLLDPPRYGDAQPRDSGQERGDHYLTWQKGIGGELQEQTPPERQRQHDATLYDEQGIPIWRARAQTHEANSLKAIARSQCKALGKTLREQRLIK